MGLTPEQDAEFETAQAIAYQIRRELVCCNVFDETVGLPSQVKEAIMDSLDFHHICFWGDAAAHIAESYPEERHHQS